MALASGARALGDLGAARRCVASDDDAVLTEERASRLVAIEGVETGWHPWLRINRFMRVMLHTTGAGRNGPWS